LQAPSSPFVPVFARTLGSPVHHLVFSPDGHMFASLGTADPLVKLWYSRPAQFSSYFRASQQYDFMYLPHPKPVTRVSPLMYGGMTS
jgi:WD40 repeat protein